jgi:hypothetical protein
MKEKVELDRSAIVSDTVELIEAVFTLIYNVSYKTLKRQHH